MLRSACSVCRSLLLCSTVDEAAGAIGMQYAACSFIKAVTSRNKHLSMAAARPLSTAGGGAGIVIDDSAVRVSSHASISPTSEHESGRALLIVDKNYGISWC
jgi:dihydroxyacid dehydratase/phosphogluconate dehydratase